MIAGLAIANFARASASRFVFPAARRTKENAAEEESEKGKSLSHCRRSPEPAVNESLFSVRGETLPAQAVSCG
jgi:hypothetical protein